MSMHFSVFNPLSKWKAGDPLVFPQVQISIGCFHTNPSGLVTIGPYLATDAEVDYLIDRLVDELNAARRAAKIQLRRTRKKQTLSIRLTQPKLP